MIYCSIPVGESPSGSCFAIATPPSVLEGTSEEVLGVGAPGNEDFEEGAPMDGGFEMGALDEDVEGAPLDGTMD